MQCVLGFYARAVEWVWVDVLAPGLCAQAAPKGSSPWVPPVFRTSLGKWTLLWRLHGAFGSRRGAGAPIWGLVCALDFGWQSLGILGDGAVSTCPELVGDAGKWIVLAAEAPWMLVW